MPHRSTSVTPSVSWRRFFWAASMADWAGAIGMGIADIMDPIYITGAPKTFFLKLCIGLIVGLVAHRIARINESTDKKYVWKWSLIASIAGLGFNVIADPLAGYFYKMYILGQPQQMAEVLAKWSTAATFVNAVISTVLVCAMYNALRPVLLKSGLITGIGKRKWPDSGLIRQNDRMRNDRNDKEGRKYFER